ncbi:MAG: tetratricopeptide repeat protein [Planctomycetes bacterium]|nr:tetratricopeptide repeat protein [Planctomycetota bacterium]
MNHRDMHHFIGLVPILAFVAVTSSPTPVEAKEKQVVTVSYVLLPERPLPAEMKTVAVMDSGVESIDGVKGNLRSKKWSSIAAELIESMLQTPSVDGESPLTVVQRRATKKILDEQDLKLAGIVEGDSATQVGKLLAVNGLIMSKIDIRVDTRRHTKETLDWTRLLGQSGLAGGPRRDPRFRPMPGGPREGNPYRPQHRPPQGPGGADMPTKTIEEISRSLTVQCSFALVDANTGRSIVQFSPPVYQKTDKAKPNFIFGGCVDEADLDPVDLFIGELVERAARDFTGMLAPTRVGFTYEIVGRGKDGEDAIRAIRADDFSRAVQLFEAAHRDDPKEDQTVFALAVTCELAGDFERALDYYRKVCSMPKVDDDDLVVYLAAKDRLASHIGRIARGKPGPAARPMP